MEHPRILHIASAVCFLTFGSNLVYAQFEAGDQCIYNGNGKAGVCKALLECPSAIESLQKQHKLPQTCGFDGTIPIVCCPLVIDPRSTVGQKSAEKCKEYAKHVFSTYVPPVLTAGPVPNRTRDECGFKVVKLIVGGEKAAGREFPHMAAIGYDSASEGRVYHCGGSLISENYVVTAGHCVYSRENGLAKYVRVGDLNLKINTDFADPQEYNIAEMIRHPDYRPPSQYNDIALARLEGQVRFTPFVRPICLTTVKDPPTRTAIATGWGKTGSYEDGSDHLLKVTLDFFSHQQCFNSFEPNARRLKYGVNETSMICAGSQLGELKDTCPGDSGGPLQLFNIDNVYCMYTLVGITSFGKVCGTTHSPAVYTRVSNYVDWIEKTVWP